MNLQEFREYCSFKKNVTESFPFDEETLVIKVKSKMFALTNINNKDFSINLKCDPMLSQALRQEYKAITPGYHMNKTHWNTIIIDGSINKEKLLFLVDLSYDLVVKGLKKSERWE
ncbi:MAG: MmcQ/YjbR family DNA-binding protein [Clostridiaceae bacterium]|nr:MmcQ/YjbR family DNA-binding protein [Clostridiaceae bacterium]